MRPGLLWTTLAVLGIGAIVALYLVDLKLSLLYSQQSGAGCNNMGEGFNCDAVNLSEYSTLFGLPISLFALHNLRSGVSRFPDWFQPGT